MQTSVARKQTFVTTALTTILVVLAYELAHAAPWLAEIPAWVVVVVAFLASNYGGQWFFDLLLRCQFGRRFLLGPTWIEGYWLLRTDIRGGKDTPLSAPGIAYLSYGEDLTIHVRSYRPLLATQAGIDRSFSATESAWLDERTLMFYNHFTVPRIPLPGRSRGMFMGKLIDDGSHAFPTKMEGEVFFFEDMTYGHQLGTKLSSKEIGMARKEYPEDWRAAIVRKHMPGSIHGQTTQ